MIRQLDKKVKERERLKECVVDLNLTRNEQMMKKKSKRIQELENFMRLENLSSHSLGDTQLNIIITTGMVKRYLAAWGVSKVQAVAMGGNGYSGADQGSPF